MTSLTGINWTSNPQTGQFDAVLYQGATINQPLALTDASNLPINITGQTAEFICDRDMTLTTAAQIYLNSSNGGIVNGGATGIFTLNMSSAATLALAPFSGFYTFWVTNGGVRSLWAQGRFRVSREAQ